jgi:putative ABC transport system permease protein
MAFLQRLRQLPSVLQAGAGNDIPLDHYESVTLVEVKGFGKPKNMIDSRCITPGYLAAFGTRVVEGRPFDDQDMKHADRVAIVNQAFARAFMAGRDPLTVQVRSGGNIANRPWATIVGVIGDRLHSALEEMPRPEYFQPYSPSYDVPNLHFAVRSLMPTKQITLAARKMLHELDPDLALDDIRTMNERISDANARRRFQTILLSTFGASAILLALGGIYGVLSYSVRQRTREMGLRMALGANRPQLFLMILRQGLGAVLLGLVFGSIGALFLTRAISSWLYEVPANDPVTYALLPLMVLLVSSIACLVPAREAMSVDPTVAIRYE